DVGGAETDRQCVPAVLDLVASHRGYPGQLLAVKQHEAAGDAVDGGDVVVVQEPVREPPVVGFAGGGSGRAVGAGHRQFRGEASVGAPADEVADFAAQGGRAGQQPLIDVGLGEPIESNVVGAQPFQQRDRGPQVDGGASDDGGRGRSVLGAPACAVQDPPGRIGGEHASVVVGGNLGEQVGNGALETDQRLVARRQGAVRDEHRAQ